MHMYTDFLKKLDRETVAEKIDLISNLSGL